MASMSGVPLPGVHLTVPASFSAAGRRVAIVGGTNGLGRAIARFLVSHGARVTVVGQTFRDEGVPGLDFVRADLSSMAEARRVADALPAEALDAVLFTNGILAKPTREETPEGIERDLAVSTLSRVVMARALAPRLGRAREDATTRPRLFVMGFPGAGQLGDPTDLNAERSYTSWPQHMNTVAGNEALVLDLAARHPELVVVGINPGLVRTDIRANVLGGTGSLRFRLVEFLIGLFTPTPDAYAARIAPRLFAPELDALSGLHLNAKGVVIQPTDGMTPTHVVALTDAMDGVLAKAGA